MKTRSKGRGRTRRNPRRDRKTEMALKKLERLQKRRKKNDEADDRQLKDQMVDLVSDGDDEEVTFELKFLWKGELFKETVKEVSRVPSRCFYHKILTYEIVPI